MNKLNIFSNTDIDQSIFLRQYWHKSPLLIRNAIELDQLTVLPDKSKLLQLCCHQDIQSRIVFKNSESNYDVEYGPFMEQDLNNLSQECWNLLVSDIDKWVPESRKLLKYFPFMRNWIFDDIMLSCGSTGGTVGPHTDHYDVFLLQVHGQRQWQFGQNKIFDPILLANQPLKLMEDFKADKSFILNPGDILYIPPEVAHYGIANTEDCVTCSIGVRMPSHSELLTSFVDQLAQNLSDNDRFEEPLFENQPKTGEITGNDLNKIKSILIKQLDINNTPIIDWFGKYISEYRSLFYEYNQVQDKKLSELFQKNEQYSLTPSPYSKSCYFIQHQTASLFINGEKYDSSIKLAELVCNDDLITSTDILNLNPNDQHIIGKLFTNGALVYVKASENN